MTREELQAIVAEVVAELNRTGVTINDTAIKESLNDVQYLCGLTGGNMVRLAAENVNKGEAELLSRLQGISADSDAATDPFKFLGEFSDPNSRELQDALDSLHSSDAKDGYQGVWRFTVLGKPATLYNFSMSYTNDRWVQGLISVYRPNSNADYTFGIDNKAHFLYRYFDGTAWGKWRDITEENKEAIADEKLRALAAEQQLQNECSLLKTDSEQLRATMVAKRNYIVVDEETATIISKYNEYWDIVVRFKKVMSNELYSIDEVFLASNNGKELSTTISSTQYQLCSQQNSDMIGPIAVNSSGVESWVGGNHLYLNQQSGVKTAKTNSYAIYADGVLLEQGAAYADEVIIKVENTIFDPGVAPANGATILSVPLITESVSYKVDAGEILVGVEHSYLKDVRVLNYYGMQSMFLPRTVDGVTSNVRFLTNQGGYFDWTVGRGPEDAPLYIVKQTAPTFKRFSQKIPAGHYQNTVLLPYGLGNHEYVGDDGNVFIYSGNKAYHVLIHKQNIEEGAVLSWMGVYNWKRPIVDDDNNYIYDYSDFKGKAISINAKKAYGKVAVPAPAYAANTLFEVIESNNNIAVNEVVVADFNLQAQGQGSIAGFCKVRCSL